MWIRCSGKKQRPSPHFDTLVNQLEQHCQMAATEDAWLPVPDQLGQWVLPLLNTDILSPLVVQTIAMGHRSHNYGFMPQNIHRSPGLSVCPSILPVRCRIYGTKRPARCRGVPAHGTAAECGGTPPVPCIPPSEPQAGDTNSSSARGKAIVIFPCEDQPLFPFHRVSPPT